MIQTPLMHKMSTAARAFAPPMHRGNLRELSYLAPVLTKTIDLKIMKNILVVLFVLGGLIGTQAQEMRLGLTAGYLNAKAGIKTAGLRISDSESGFFAGLAADFEASDKFNIQPELLYANVNDSEGLILPILGRIGLSDRFNLQVGPQFVFSLEESMEEISNFEFDLVGGIGFDIDKDFFLEARYSVQLNNSYTGSEDFKVRANYLTVGLGYWFF